MTDTTAPGWSPRPSGELVEQQLRALDHWHATRRAVERSLQVREASREAQLDARRRLDVLRREQAALVERAETSLRKGWAVVGDSRPRAVVAHRNEWFRTKLCGLLEHRGVKVLAALEDGAEASAALVLEQPDLLLVEDLLPGLSGVELLGRAHDLAPRTVVGAQAATAESMALLVERGASAVFSRRVPPADVAKELVGCLSGGGLAQFSWESDPVSTTV